MAAALYDQFILFGDSMFQHSTNQQQGWSLAPALQNEYIRRLDVLNRGFSGFNTDQALRVLPRIIPSPSQARVRFLVILLGANDSCLKGAAGSQHVPLERFKSNMKQMVTHSQVMEQQPRIILVTPPPINEYACEEQDRSKGYFDPRRKANHTALYAQAVREVAEEDGVALLDLNKVFLDKAGQRTDDAVLEGSKDKAVNMFLRMHLHDGLHMTNIAYVMFFEELMQTIGRTWPDQLPDRLPYVVPAWNDGEAWK